MGNSNIHLRDYYGPLPVDRLNFSGGVFRGRCGMYHGQFSFCKQRPVTINTMQPPAVCSHCYRYVRSKRCILFMF